jgi:hypothetical protein
VLLKVGFALLVLAFAAWAPLAAAALGGSWLVVVVSLPVAWVAGFLCIQVIARRDANIAAVGEWRPSAILALPLGGLILGVLGVVFASLGIEV